MPEEVIIEVGGGGRNRPLLAVENGDNGIGHEMVVVDQVTGGIAEVIRDAQSQGPGRAGKVPSLIRTDDDPGSLTCDGERVGEEGGEAGKMVA